MFANIDQSAWRAREQQKLDESTFVFSVRFSIEEFQIISVDTTNDYDLIERYFPLTFILIPIIQLAKNVLLNYL